MSTDNGFGTPKHNSDRKSFPEGPKEGVSEIRILPPILAQRESGKYVQDHTCHYGYGTKLQNSDKERPNPFYCVEVGKWVSGKFVVTQECPECQAIKLVKTQKERIEAQMKQAGNSDEVIAEAVKSLTAWLKKHNRDFKQYVNVKTADSRYLTMKLPQKDVWKKIKAFIDEYKQNSVPIDAIAAQQGLWFRISRSGKGFKTDYGVEVAREEVLVNGQVIPGASKPKQGPLTMEDAKKAAESCMDIGDVGIRRLSIEQVQRLVASKGDQNVVQAIFEASDPVGQQHAPVEREESPEDIAAGPVPVSAPTPAPTPAPVAPVAPVVTAPPDAGTVPEDVIAKARAMLASAKASPAPAATPAAAPAPAATPAATPVAVQQLVADKPTPAPTPAPPAATTAAEQSFLDQFKM